MNRLEIIAKEREEKARGLKDLNGWLKEKGYGYEVVNYTAGRFDGSREDNEKTVETIKFVAEYRRKNSQE